MKTGKRILSVLLAVLMLALTVSVAFAAEDEKIVPKYVIYQLPYFETWNFNTLNVAYQNPKYPYSEPGYENDCSLWFGRDAVNAVSDEDETVYLCVYADYNRPFYINVKDNNGTCYHQFEIKGFQYSSCRTATQGSYYCTKCQQTLVVTFPATHIFGNPVVRREPSCTEGAIVSRYCARCNEVQTVTGEPWGHNYDRENARVVKPTCFTEGYTEVKCTRCEKIQMIDIKPATGNHKDNNKDGYCDTCGTKWPKPAPEPTTQPAAEKDEEKAPKQNIFQRIIEWFKNLFKKLFK